MHYPHEPLPNVQLSFSQLVATYRYASQTLNDIGEGSTIQDKSDFINTVLCGRLKEPLKRLNLNARQSADIPTLDQCTIARDFDSIIGITDTLPYTAPISIFPVPSFKDTLTKKVHLTGSAFLQPVCVFNSNTY